jgi:hypothetical protein
MRLYIKYKGESEMYIDRWLRIVAGFFVMLSLALAHYHSPNWLWFTAFIGLNLFQSGFTNWCPMVTILKMLGVPRLPKECCK